MATGGGNQQQSKRIGRTEGIGMTKAILQVEDDANDVFLLEYAMKRIGATNPIYVAKDGREAINYLSGAGEFADRGKYPLPALVLLDLKLPYVMGFDVLRWIRMQPDDTRTIAVVILSASALEIDVGEAYRSGASAYVVKPSSMEKLEELARSLRDFWLVQNTAPILGKCVARKRGKMIREEDLGSRMETEAGCAREGRAGVSGRKAIFSI
jgi:CheY-like chemotaxis protein